MPNRVTTPALLLLMSGLLTGCQWLLGGDGSECIAASDCPPRMLCTAARCVDEIESANGLDGGTADATLRDMRLDASIEPPPDTLDMSVPLVDAALPGEIEAPFPDGQCFGSSASVQLNAGVTDIPGGLCTRFGVLWTSTEPTGHLLNIARTWPPDETVITTPLAQGAQLSTFDGRFVAFAAPGADAAPVPTVLDLGMRVPEPVSVRDLVVTEVRRGNGLTAYVTEGKLFLTPDAEAFGTFSDCSQPGRRQWGVATAQGQVAWFERANAGGPTQVVIARPSNCKTRLVFPAGGVVAPDARIEVAHERWLWLATIAGDPQVVGLATDDRGRLRPLQLELRNAPVQIAAQGDWLAAVSFVEGAWHIEAVHLPDGRVRDLSDGSNNHRNPLIWNGYLTWAVMSQQGWGVQYAPLL